MAKKKCKLLFIPCTVQNILCVPGILRTIFILLCFLTGAAGLRGQDAMHFDSYGVDDGLLQSTIWGIAQDRNGFLWISTSDGMCKFDGYDFVPCDNVPGGRKSISGWISSDSKGNIGFKHYLGLSKYDVTSDTIVKIFQYKTRRSDDVVFGEDSKGNMWVGLVEAGMLKIDNTSNKIIRTFPFNDSFITPSSRLNSGFVDKKDRIWITQSRKGLVCYDIPSGKFRKYLDTITTLSVTALNDSVLLVGSTNQLYLFNTCNFHIFFIDQINMPTDLKMHEAIVSTCKDMHNNIWHCTVRGVYIFDAQKLRITSHIASFSDDVRNYSKIQNAFCDQSGNMWIGTDGDGLKKLPNNTKKFHNYPHRTEGGNMVKAIDADSSNVYVGYFDNGIDVYDRSGRRVRHIDKRRLPGLSVYALSDIDGTNKLMLLDRERLAIFNSKTDVVTDLQKVMERDIPGEVHEKENHTFIVRSRKHFGYVGRDDRLIRIDGSSAGNIRLTEVHTFNNELLRCAFISSSGRLYVGTTLDFYYQDNEEGSWIKGQLPAATWVKNIAEDKEGNIWVGTIEGIFVYGPDQKLLQYFNEKNQLKNNFIYEMACDDKGRMWISHNKGLSVYEPRSKSFHHYTKEDGLPSNEFNTGAFFKAADGEFFFGGINGIVSFYPDEIINNPVLPTVQITKIKLLDEPLQADSAFWQINALAFPYNKNILSFEFSALEFTNSNRNQYAYMMEGIDPEWIQSGNKRFARYSNMPPGHYAFKVKASNNDGVWSPKEKTIYITITPPYWQQSWFVALYLLAGVSLVAAIVFLFQRARFKKKLRAIELQQKIQNERERISRDLHDSVGTQLSLISNNIEWIAYPLKEFTETERAEKLKSLNQKSREVISTLRESIWALNKEAITMEEFSDKLKSFIQKQLQLYTHIKLQYKEDISQNLVLGPNEALNLFRICQEGISNSLKYSDASILQVAITTTEGKYRVAISDNGKGFTMSDRNALEGHGLDNMKHRAGEIDSTLEIIPVVGTGTTFIISKN